MKHANGMGAWVPLVLLTVLAGCTGSSDRYAQYLARAQAQINAGSFDKALVDVTNAMQIDSSQPGAHYLHALILERQQRWRAMHDELVQVVALAPTNVEARIKLGTILLANGRYDDALAQARAVLAMDTTRAEAYALIAATFLRQDDVEQAIRSAETALQHNPDSLGAKAVLSEIYKTTNPSLALSIISSNGNAGSALQELLAASVHQAANNPRRAQAVDLKLLHAQLEVEPNNAATLKALADVYVTANRQGDAIAFLESHAAKYPHHTDAPVLIGNLHAQVARFAEAQSWYRTAIERNLLNTAAYIELGELSIQQGNNRKALDLFLEGLEAVPNDPALLARAAHATELLGHYADSIKLYETATRLGPQDWSVNNLAMLYADHSPTPANLSRIAALLKPYVNNAEPVLLDTLGWVYYRMGEDERAIRWLCAAREKGGTGAALRYHLGMAYAHANQPELAARELSSALESGEIFFGLETARAQLEALGVHSAQAAAGKGKIEAATSGEA